MSNIPKDMKLLVSEADFERLTQMVDPPPPPVVKWECTVVLAKWKNVEKGIQRIFDTEAEADWFCAEVVAAGGKVKKNPKPVEIENG